MVFGIGTDIIEIDRVRKALERNPRLLNRLFTDYEISYFQKRNMQVQHIAGSFSAKEAIVKAMGTGLRGFCWKDVEVLRGSSGKPVVKLYNKAKAYAAEKNIGTVFVSISHSRSYAIANAVAELSAAAAEEANDNTAYEAVLDSQSKIN